MTVRELIHEILRSGVDMDAEVMISAPLECNRGAPGKGPLILPTLGIEVGSFPESALEELKGRPWVKFRGTDAWGQFFPREYVQKESTPAGWASVDLDMTHGVLPTPGQKK